MGETRRRTRELTPRSFRQTDAGSPTHPTKREDLKFTCDRSQDPEASGRFRPGAEGPPSGRAMAGSSITGFPRQSNHGGGLQVEGRVRSDKPIFNPGRCKLDLHPDGKRFAVFPMPEAEGPEKGTVHVTFLENFLDELQRRIPASRR